MPELFDLDRAFEDLTRDVGTHTRPPGADRAWRTARRRRTTKVAAGALVVLVGAGAVAVRLQAHDRVVQPADDLPAPQRLTTQVMDGVTAGWVSGWTEPTSVADVPSDLNPAGNDCMDSLLGDGADGSVASTGASVFLSGHSLAFSRGVAMKTEAAAQRAMSAAPSAACSDVRRSAPAPDTDLLTARASDGNGHAVFAVARWHERVAFLGISDPTRADPDAVRVALGQALLAAIQDQSTVSVMSGIAGEALQTSGGTATGSGSSTTPSYSMSGPTGAQLAEAFGSWAAGYHPSGGAVLTSPPDCLRTLSVSGSSESVGDAAMVGMDSYGSAEEAAVGVNVVAKSLAGCGFRVQGDWRTGPLMATRGGGKPVTFWFVRDGLHIGSVQLEGWSDPPQPVTDAVDGLLVSALATAKVAHDSSSAPPVAVMTASAVG